MEMENQVQAKIEEQVDTQPQVQEEPKMVSMTQEQLDKMIADRLARQERKLNEAFDKKLNELTEAKKFNDMDEKKKAEYNSLLDISGSGIMGHIEIPKINT